MDYTNLSCNFDDVVLLSHGDNVCNYTVVPQQDMFNIKDVEQWSLEHSDLVRESQSLDGPLRGLPGSRNLDLLSVL